MRCDGSKFFFVLTEQLIDSLELPLTRANISSKLLRSYSYAANDAQWSETKFVLEITKSVVNLLPKILIQSKSVG